jgi:hypothetical protein
MRRGVIGFCLLFLVSCGGGSSPTSSTPQPFHQTMTGTVGVFDIVQHQLNIPRQGNMTVSLTWNQNADLDMYLTSSTCNSYPPSSCSMLATSNNLGAARETITRTVQSGETYKLWVDNFSHSLTANYTIDLTIQ